MPNYVDYSTQDLNGTPVHTFVDASGSQSPPLYGPEADALASSIEQNRSLQQASMPNQSLPPPEPTGPQADMMPPPAPPSYSQAAADQARTPIGPPAPPPATPEEQQRAAELAQAQQIHQAAASGNPMAGQVDPGAYVNRPVHTAGVSRQQLQQRAAGAVAIPKSGEETVEGAAPYDQDAAEARAQANLDMRIAKQQQAEMIAARAERDAAMFDQQAATAALKIQREQQKQQLVEEGVAQDAAHAREFRDQVAKQQVDPGRLFSGDRGAFNTVAAVIGQALGAFAAAGGGNNKRITNAAGMNISAPAGAQGQNFAKQIIDGAIDRDIRAQEVNIRSNQDMAQNQLNDIYRRVGDMNQAKAILWQMQQDYAGLNMKAMAARDGSPDAMNAYQMWEAANAADRAEQERKFMADSYGKHTVKVATQFASPQAGGTRAPTEAEIRSRIQTQKDLGELGVQGRKQEAELGSLESQAVKNRAEAEKAKNGGDENPTLVADYNKQSSQIDSTLSKLTNFVHEHGGQIDANGNITGMSAPLDIPGGDTGHTAKAKTDLTVLGREFAGVINQGSEPNPDLLSRVTPSLGTVRNSGLESSLSSMYQTLQQQKAGHDASVSANVRARRTGNTVDAGVQRLRQQQQGAQGGGGGGIRQQ